MALPRNRRTFAAIPVRYGARHANLPSRCLPTYSWLLRRLSGKRGLRLPYEKACDACLSCAHGPGVPCPWTASRPCPLFSRRVARPHREVAWPGRDRVHPCKKAQRSTQPAGREQGARGQLSGDQLLISMIAMDGPEINGEWRSRFHLWISDYFEK